MDLKSNLLDMQREMIEGAARGEFVEGMEKYYAEDVYQVEMGDGTRKEGLAKIVADEKEFLTQVKTFHGIDIFNIAVASDDGNGNGVTLAEYTIKADLKNGSKFWPQQVHVSEWKDGKVVAIRFYYNPNFGS